MFLHPGDLSIWEVLLILTFSALMLFIFVGLPLGPLGTLSIKLSSIGGRCQRASSLCRYAAPEQEHVPE